MERKLATRLLALALVALGCGGDSVAASAVGRIDLSHQTLSLLVGATQQITARIYDAQGNQLSGRPVSFTSGNSEVASVTTGGLVTGVSVGSTTITASSEGRTATTSVSVTRPQVASVGVTPSSLSLGVGATAPLTAVALGAAGDTLPGRTFTFTSANTSVATVSNAGVVSGVSVGSTTVTVASEGQSRAVPVTVVTASSAPVAQVVLTPTVVSLQTGTTSQLTATALDASGTVLSGRSFSFVSSNNSVATVSSTGLVSGVAAGSATITASSEG